MNQQAAREKAAQAIQTAAAEQKNLERQRAIDSYQKEGRAHFADVQYEKALAAYQKAAALVDRVADPLAWAEVEELVANILSDLARYQESEPLQREVLRLREQHLGPTHAKTAIALNNLARSLQETNRFTEAEPLLQRVVTILEAAHGKEHPDVATAINNLAHSRIPTASRRRSR
jgi:tetratricopeptide (TPR) repeat protein